MTDAMTDAMTHDELRDLLPAYALGALEADEAAAVEEHLAGCREHDLALAEFHATAAALATLAEEHDVSQRLAARIARIPGGGEATARPRWIARWRPFPLTAAAAAVALLAVFGLGWLAGTRLSTAPPERYSYAIRGSGDTLVRFSGAESAAVVRVTMAGLPRLPSDQRYVLWAVRDSGWTVIGRCNTNAQGRWQGDFGFALAPHEDVALTIEPADGGTRPTTEPLLRTQF